MPNTSLPNNIIHQLEDLSVEQLLEVRAKVDALLSNKSVVPRLGTRFVSLTMKDFISPVREVNWLLSPSGFIPPTVVNSLNRLKVSSLETIVITTPQDDHGRMPEKLEEEVQEKAEDKVNDKSVENALKLVEKWLEEESDYDEKNYPEIEAGLQRNRVSL